MIAGTIQVGRCDGARSTGRRATVAGFRAGADVTRAGSGAGVGVVDGGV
jgi:hypothetical protein